MVRLLVIGTTGPHPLLLNRGNCLPWSAELQARLGSHLDKDQGIFLPGNNINFTVRTAVVGFQDAIAPLLQEISGQFFTQNTGVSSFHSALDSRTPNYRQYGTG